MSLQVWLPLKGNLENLGLDEITINDSGLIFDNDGKIGKALSMYGVPQKSFTIPSLVNAQIFSFSFWYKPIEDSSLTTNWRNIVFFGDVNTEGTSGTLRVQSSYGTGKDNYTISIHNNATYSIAQAGIVYTKTWNGWCHVAFTCDGKTCNYYTNGELIKSESCNGGKLTGIAYLGSGGNNNPNGLLNDFRIYDHCLSPKEVKLISQALVCHYPLNDFVGGENLICDTLKDSGKSHTSYDICDYYFTEGLVSGTKYTVSIKLTASSEKKSFAVYHSGGSYNITPWINFNGSDFYTYTFTATNNHASQTSGTYGHGFARVYVSNNASAYQGSTTITGTANVEWIKIEEGSIATPWVPNTSDALYSAMGFDGDTVYDCSGYENNGTVTGTITSNVNTPRYSTCDYFNGSSYIITRPGEFPWSNYESLTVSAWIKPTTTPSSYSGSVGITHNSGAGNKSFAISNYAGKFTVNTVNGSTYINTQSSYTMPLNEWHHYAATLDGTTVKMYVDGAQIHTGTISWGTATIHANPQINIGVDLPGSDEKYTGYYSDVRIYATALSADDVKELYETSASVDNHGNMYAYEFNES